MSAEGRAKSQALNAEIAQELRDEATRPKQTPAPTVAPVKKMPDRSGKKVVGRKPAASQSEMLLSAARTEDRQINAVVRDYILQTVRQLGGWSRISAGARALLLAQKVALTVILVAEREITSRESLTNEKGEVATRLTRILPSYLSSFRQNQVALGLARGRLVEGKTETVDDVVQEYARRKKDVPALVPLKLDPVS